MDGNAEATFRIDGYTPATLPLERLAEYLAQIAIMLGEPKSVHFVKLKKGSVVPVLNVDRAAVPKVRARAASVRIGIAPTDAMRAYNTINKYLHEDNSIGTFKLVEKNSTSAEIIRFPGREAETENPIIVKQDSSIDGELIKVGGYGKYVPIILKGEDVAFTNCYAHRSIAEGLGRHMFKQVRLFGAGTWSKPVNGPWALARFKINSFKPLKDTSLTDALRDIAVIKDGNWDHSSLAELEAIRGGEEI